MRNQFSLSQISSDTYLDFKDVLLKPVSSSLDIRSRADVKLEVECKFTDTDFKFNRIPIFVANMDSVGTVQMHSMLANTGICVALHKYVTLEQYKVHFAKYLNVDPASYAVSIGGKDSDIDFLKEVFEHTNAEIICIDVANGYLNYFSDFVSKVKSIFPNKVIIAGNVVCSTGALKLFNAGADIVKLGIGSGSVCHTRIVAGTGVPQFSAVFNTCNDFSAFGKYSVPENKYIMSDGGCTNPGDFALAFAAGAHFVMSGGFFAGHDETCKTFYGMSSEDAMKKYHGGIASHRASEGKTVEFKTTKGPLLNSVQSLLGGLRSACTYQGVDSLHDIAGATFVKVSSQYNTVYNNLEK